MPRNAEMCALVYARGKDGGMAFRDSVAVPQVSSMQVLIKVHAAAINPVDYKKPKIPLVASWLAPDDSVVGIDVSGTVVEKGDVVSQFEVGDEVFGFARGSLAQYAVCDVSKLALKPEALSHVHAAALPTAAVTSYQALRDNGLEAGSRLLVLGASGGCGLAGVAIGKMLGAVVTGVCSDRNANVVKQVGCDVVVDYAQGETAFAALRDFDMVLDTVTGSGTPSDPDYELRFRGALKPGRPYVALNAGASDWLRLLVAKAAGRRQMFQREAYDLVLTDQNGLDLQILGDWAVSGKLQLPIDSVFDFSAVSAMEAFAKLKSRRSVGKIVLEMSN